jgi:hypothetical protein
MMIKCQDLKTAFYSARWCWVSKKMMPKMFSRKVTYWSIISGLYGFPVQRFVKCSNYHQVVSGVKINTEKNVLSKNYPHKYFFKFELWLVLFKPPITGVFQLITGRPWKSKKLIGWSLVGYTMQLTVSWYLLRFLLKRAGFTLKKII